MSYVSNIGASTTLPTSSGAVGKRYILRQSSAFSMPKGLENSRAVSRTSGAEALDRAVLVELEEVWARMPGDVAPRLIQRLLWIARRLQKRERIPGAE